MNVSIVLHYFSTVFKTRDTYMACTKFAKTIISVDCIAKDFIRRSALTRYIFCFKETLDVRQSFVLTFFDFRDKTIMRLYSNLTI